MCSMMCFLAGPVQAPVIQVQCKHQPAMAACTPDMIQVRMGMHAIWQHCMIQTYMAAAMSFVVHSEQSLAQHTSSSRAATEDY